MLDEALDLWQRSLEKYLKFVRSELG
jgi:two-component system aerobic respiration control sensor histidine kinase ArcB